MVNGAWNGEEKKIRLDGWIIVSEMIGWVGWVVKE